MTNRPEVLQRLDAEQVRSLCGDLLDSTIAAIVETGATTREVEAALAWVEGLDDAMGEAREALTGAAAAVYDLLTAERDPFEEP